MKKQQIIPIYTERDCAHFRRVASIYQETIYSVAQRDGRKTPESSEHVIRAHLPVMIQLYILSDFPNLVTPFPVVTEIVTCCTDNTEIGYIKYGVSPILETIYLFDIRIDPHAQRQGYATAALVSLYAKYHNMPITPVHPVIQADQFWGAAYGKSGDIFTLLPYIMSGDMDEEKAKWSHLWDSPISLHGGLPFYFCNETEKFIHNCEKATQIKV